jgi:hypothetical protein
MRIALSLGIVVTMVMGTAAASPLRIRNGSSVRVAIHGKREMGVGLRARAGGWRLELATGENETVDVVDITDGANAARWTVEVLDGALLLDEERFVAGHAYRVTLRHGTAELGTALVYLYPPSAAGRHQLTFDDAEAGSAGGGDISISKKPTL